MYFSNICIQNNVPSCYLYLADESCYLYQNDHHTLLQGSPQPHEVEILIGDSRTYIGLAIYSFLGFHLKATAPQTRVVFVCVH
jgi:hypothetical protein